MLNVSVRLMIADFVDFMRLLLVTLVYVKVDAPCDTLVSRSSIFDVVSEDC